MGRGSGGSGRGATRGVHAQQGPASAAEIGLALERINPKSKSKKKGNELLRFIRRNQNAIVATAIVVGYVGLVIAQRREDEADVVEAKKSWNYNNHHNGTAAYTGAIRNLTYERMGAFAPDGTLLIEAGGRKHDVGLSNAVFKHPTYTQSMLKNATVIHNHPNGSPFSQGDFEFAKTYNVKELRAVTREGTHVLTRPSTGWKSNEFSHAVRGYTKHTNNLIATRTFSSEKHFFDTMRRAQESYFSNYDFHLRPDYSRGR